MKQMSNLSALELFERRLFSLTTAEGHCGHDRDDPEEVKCQDNRQMQIRTKEQRNAITSQYSLKIIEQSKGQVKELQRRTKVKYIK